MATDVPQFSTDLSPLRALEILAQRRTDREIVVTNQGAARLWPLVSDHPLDVNYNPSTMGGAIPFGLGLALAQPRFEVIVVTGDGALLMSLGSLVSAAAAEAANLRVVVMDNRRYEVTGGQRIPGAGRIDYVALARGAGLAHAESASNESEWEERAGRLRDFSGPSLWAVSVQEIQRGAYPPSDGPSLKEQLGRLQEALKRG